MKCWNCGREIERGGSSFCPNCGANLAGAPGAKAEGQEKAAAQASAMDDASSAAPAAGTPNTDARPAMPEVLIDQTQRYVTPLPSNAWSQPASPASEYDSLGADYQTPQTVVSGGVDSPEQAKEDYKRAKKELKEARKRAGKSNAPKVIAAIVAVVLVAGGAAAAMYYFDHGNSFDPNGGQVQEQPADESSSRDSQSSSDSTDPTDKTDASASSTPKDSSTSTTGGSSNATKENALVGTWTGDLKKSSSGLMDCYGSQKMPPVLTVKSVDSAGKITADLKFCYHAHASSDNPVDSSPNDAYIEADDITMTNNNGFFTYEFDMHSFNKDYDDSDSYEIKFTLDENATTPELTATATSWYYPDGSGFGDSQIEDFEFSKTS